jgi:hypothetical protein
VIRPSRKHLHALLIAIFWIAQVQGTVHAVGHLGSPAGVSDRATVPHSVLCLECAAVSQAGAAPVLSLPTTFLASPTGGLVETTAAAVIAADPLTAYRSRAPPISPI